MSFTPGDMYTSPTAQLLSITPAYILYRFQDAIGNLNAIAISLPTMRYSFMTVRVDRVKIIVTHNPHGNGFHEPSFMWDSNICGWQSDTLFTQRIMTQPMATQHTYNTS